MMRTESQRGLCPSIAHDINNALEALGNLLYILESEPNLTHNGRGSLKLAREEIQRSNEIPPGLVPGDLAGVSQLQRVVTTPDTHSFVYSYQQACMS